MHNFDNNDLSYLKGEQFSSIYLFKLKGHSQPVNRMTWLKHTLAGKKVIHFGCVDHLPLIEERRKAHAWLHEEITKVCTRVVGVDIVQDGIDYMNAHGFEAYNANVVTQEVPDAIKAEKWDYLVAGEVLEHIGDPVQFLKAIQAKYGPYTENIIVTVPNAFSYTNFRRALKNTEMINSDHRFWFTGFTLAKVAADAGIKIEGVDFCVDSLPSVFSIKYHVIKNRPNFWDRVLLVGKFMVS